MKYFLSLRYCIETDEEKYTPDSIEEKEMLEGVLSSMEDAVNKLPFELDLDDSEVEAE